MQSFPRIILMNEARQQRSAPLPGSLRQHGAAAELQAERTQTLPLSLSPGPCTGQGNAQPREREFTAELQSAGAE